MDIWFDPPTMFDGLRLSAAFVVSAIAVFLSIRYAYWRGLFDQPGQRRSHSVPTPRGGGIGIVLAIAVIFIPSLYVQYPGVDGVASAILASILAIAAIGWLDDHHGLSAPLRLGVHIAAALALATTLMAHENIYIIILFAFAIVWSINLHNFMDGINGLLATQALFVFGVLGVLGWHDMQHAYAVGMFTLVAATLGFLPFNFPHAHIFMGDVGSGVLGLLIAAAIGMAFGNGSLGPGTALILVSAFMIDASCTLLLRIVHGRRWYSAHREHLYQWLVRAKYGHARVVVWYAGWNLFIVIPALLISGTTQGYQVAMTGIVYAVGVSLWWFGKIYCLHIVRRQKANHVSA